MTNITDSVAVLAIADCRSSVFRGTARNDIGQVVSGRPIGPGGKPLIDPRQIVARQQLVDPARLERARGPIDAKRASHESQLEELSRQWDALVDRDAPAADRRAVLEALRERVLERNYINNLLAGIERELAGIASVG